ASVLGYRGADEAFRLVARGGGSLVASIYGDDRDFLARAVHELGAAHGRLLLVDPTIADQHTGHGIVMPQCHHGGPGRAGNGEELGGLNGLRLYHQRVAVQGSSDVLAALQAGAGSLHWTITKPAGGGGCSGRCCGAGRITRRATSSMPMWRAGSPTRSRSPIRTAR